MSLKDPVWHVVWLGLALSLALMSTQPALAQSAEPVAPLFAAQEPLRIRLIAPFGRVFRKSNDPEYADGQLVFTRPDGSEATAEVRLRTRGKSRVTACAFPPLLLNLARGQLDGTVFEGQNRLKLVTHCAPQEANEQYLLTEYLAYRVLNLLTDMSLRVRLLEVTYFDSEREREIASKRGFLIEDEERFAEQRGLKVVAEERIARDRYDSAALGLVEMFQYFIGNTDWAATAGPAGDNCCHNVVPFERPDGRLIPVPYDFDSTGIVNPPYALPAEGLGIRTVRARLYRGTCHEPAEIEAAYAPFVAHRAEIASLFEPGLLTQRYSTSALGFIEDFYELLADPKRSQRAFAANCPR